MASYAKRGANDILISPDNSVLTVIDYQPIQIDSVNSMNRSQLVVNAETVIKLAKIFGIPIVLSTVNAGGNQSRDTIPRLRMAIGEAEPSYDRSSINAWEDKEYSQAIKASGRKKIIMLALWTEACLCFPALDALREGYEVYPVVDAVGGTSLVAHDAALRRMEQAGAQPISIAQLGCELQRDWNRAQTVQPFVELMSGFGAFNNFG